MTRRNIYATTFAVASCIYLIGLPEGSDFFLWGSGYFFGRFIATFNV
jgi:uncharacterized membrane protein YiaA